MPSRRIAPKPCQNASASRPELMQDDELLYLMRLFTELGFDKFRLTGGEPLVRGDLADIVRGMKSVPGVEVIGLSTNGTRLEKLAQPLRDAGVDTLVLGCTHYPLLTGVISYVMGEEVTLVSSAEETAKDLYRVLVEKKILRTADSKPHYTFVASGNPDNFAALARRFLGPEVVAVTAADQLNENMGEAKR